MTDYSSFQKIILIDDDILLNFTNRKLIHIIGFKGEVFDFNNGYQAIKYIQEEIRINTELNLTRTLIILDLEMPVLNGWGFLKCFEALEHSIRNLFHVVVSSSSISSLGFYSEFKTVNEYIPKPLSKDIMERLIFGVKV